MSVRYRADIGASAATAWSLLARPGRWHEWAPHLCRASAIGDPEVQPGRIGVIWIFGFAPVPVKITARRPGHSWSWRVGPVEIEHEVLARGTASTVLVTIVASPAIEAAVRHTYGRAVPLLLARLARLAEQEQ